MSGKDKGKEGYLAPHLKKLLKLDSISLVQFKNYIHKEFRFGSRIVGVSGRNGIGKTNLLDAIYYLCFTKGYFARSDAQNAHNGMAGFRIDGTFSYHGQAISAVCILRETGRKEFLVDGAPYEKFALHVGRFPCVIIAPDDVRIITEGAEERRRFIDAILSQINGEYLQRLINYNKILQQRNSFLKAMAENRFKDTGLLEVYDEQLVTDGEFIFNKRKEFMGNCITLVTDFYYRISGAREPVTLKYESQLLHSGFAQLLSDLREKDMLAQRTNGGIHKDDIQILLNAQPFKNIASQGQRKSLLFALKLSEFELLKKEKSFAPLLLLDDVFEKLDETRMHNLLDWVCLSNEGQLFITDTHPERIRDHFNKLGIEYQLINL